MFGEFEANRELNHRHVKTLMESIAQKNLLHLTPIIVDHDMKIIDGQHRLEAARQLGVDIYYIVDDGISKGDISHLNSNKKNWTLMDYINFHTVEKRSGFSTLSRFLSENPMIPTSAAIALLDPNGRRNSKDVMAGYVDTSNIEQAKRIAEFLRWLRNHYDLAYNSTVISVIRQFFDNPDFDAEFFKEKILDQPRSLVKCVNARQYREMFLEIYNYRLSANRIQI